MLKARLPAGSGMLFLKALDAVVEEEIPTARVPAGTLNRCSQDPDAGECPSRSALRADALAVLAGSFLAHGDKALIHSSMLDSCGRQRVLCISPGYAGQRAQPHVLAAALPGEAPFAKPFPLLARLAARGRRLPGLIRIPIE